MSPDDAPDDAKAFALDPELLRQAKAVARLAVALTKAEGGEECFGHKEVKANLSGAWKLLRESALVVRTTGRKECASDYQALSLPVPQELRDKEDTISFRELCSGEPKYIDFPCSRGQSDKIIWGMQFKLDDEASPSEERKSGFFSLVERYVRENILCQFGTKEGSNGKSMILDELCEYSDNWLNAVPAILYHSVGLSGDRLYAITDSLAKIPRPIGMKPVVNPTGLFTPYVPPDPALLEWATKALDQAIDERVKPEAEQLWQRAKKRGFLRTEVRAMAKLRK